MKISQERIRYACSRSSFHFKQAFADDELIYELDKIHLALSGRIQTITNGCLSRGYAPAESEKSILRACYQRIEAVLEAQKRLKGFFEMQSHSDICAQNVINEIYEVEE